MLNISFCPVNISTDSVLHLIHPLDKNNPDVINAINSVKSDTRQIAYLGQHFLSNACFFHPTTVILHGTSDKNLMNMLKLLKQSNYADRFLRLKEDPKKQLFVYGNAVKLLTKTMLIIPKDNPMISSAIPSISRIDTSTAGLGIIDIALDLPFDQSSIGEKYLRVLQRLSKQFSVFLMDATVLYRSDGKVRFGEIFQMQNGVLKKIKELPMDLTEADREAFIKRRVPPARAIYKEETSEEKKETEVTTAKSVDKVDEKHST